MMRFLRQYIYQLVMFPLSRGCNVHFVHKQPLPSPCRGRALLAFTLAELLIALAILGVIATFTIPKILDSGSSSERNSIALETVATVTGALQNARLDGSLSAATKMMDLTQYMNYVRLQTTGSVDDAPTYGTFSCSAGNHGCTVLHNGGVLFYLTDAQPSAVFGGTTATDYVTFGVDPDGTANGQTATSFVIFYNGRLTQWGIYSGVPARDASWFSWGN